MAKYPDSVAALKSTDVSLGLTAGTVQVVDHDPAWAQLFDDLQLTVSAALADHEPLVEHIGSTSVPGLAAKPVLDIAVGIAGEINTETIAASLGEVGFNFEEDLGMYGGLFFTVHSAPDVVVSHLHVVATDDFQWRWYLAFRDGLRANPELRSTYQQLKQQAASANGEDRDGYNKAKFDWVLATVSNLADA